MSHEFGPVAQALWLAVPVTLAGLTHVLALKRNVLPQLADVRLDGGLELRGRPLFGANKTLRGAVIMIGACIVWTTILDLLQRGLGLDDSIRFIRHDQLGSLGLGLGLGIAYIAGELPNSLIKRQLDIGPGEAPEGVLGRVFWLIDQIDSTLAVLVFLSCYRVPSLAMVLSLLVLTVLVHPSIAAIMVALGLKRRVG